jgi:hypothetical protein
MAQITRQCDLIAPADWGWQPAYDLDEMTSDILQHLPELLPSFQ